MKEIIFYLYFRDSYDACVRVLVRVNVYNICMYVYRYACMTMCVYAYACVSICDSVTDDQRLIRITILKLQRPARAQICYYWILVYFETIPEDHWQDIVKAVNWQQSLVNKLSQNLIKDTVTVSFQNRFCGNTISSPGRARNCAG